MKIDVNALEIMAKERPNEVFLKGSGVLKLIAEIKRLESVIEAAKYINKDLKNE